MDVLATVQSFLQQQPVVTAALGGALVAARVDIAAFAAWKRFDDALAYDWGVAVWRWFQGAVLAALFAAGVSA